MRKKQINLKQWLKKPCNEFLFSILGKKETKRKVKAIILLSAQRPNDGLAKQQIC